MKSVCILFVRDLANSRVRTASSISLVRTHSRPSLRVDTISARQLLQILSCRMGYLRRIMWL